MFKIKSYFEIEEKSKFLRKNKKNFKIFFVKFCDDKGLM